MKHFGDMTDRMINALNHIKTSADVDPWAAEEVERVFKAIGDIKAKISADLSNAEKDSNRTQDDLDIGICMGLRMALNTIDKCKEESEG